MDKQKKLKNRLLLMWDGAVPLGLVVRWGKKCGRPGWYYERLGYEPVYLGNSLKSALLEIDNLISEEKWKRI